MNTNSKLCVFINSHENDWEQLLCKDYKLLIKKDGDLAIFNYNSGADFSKPIVQEARGIILNYKTKEVVCWPFRKFCNYIETYADTIDWNSAKVQEKVDGSIIKLWYDFEKSKWQFSTNGNIRAENSIITNTYQSFYDIIKQASNYKDIDFDKLDKQKTYIFELVSPETRVVIDYHGTKLFHIGTRNNITGIESEDNIGITKPRVFEINSLEKCIDFVLKMNKGDNSTYDPNKIDSEGFVVVDKNYNRIKVKSPEYIIVNNLVGTKTLSKKDTLLMLINDSEENRKNLEFICKNTPSIEVQVKFYQYQLAKLKFEATEFGKFTKKLYEEYDHDRKAVSNIIKNHPLSFIAFRCLSTDTDGSEILMSQPFEKIIKLFPDYKSENFMDLFKSDKNQ